VPLGQPTIPPIQSLVEVPILLCNDENPASSEKVPEKTSEKLLNITGLMDDDFDDFMSCSKSFMPSQLLLNPETSSFSLLDDDSTMQKQDSLLPIVQEKSSPVASASNTYKTKNAILDLFSRTKPATAVSNEKPSTVGGDKKTKPSKGGEKNKDMSAWFQLFADLDPLSNPSKLDEVEANNHDSHAA
jgi:islet cell auto antigen 1